MYDFQRWYDLLLKKHVARLLTKFVLLCVACCNNCESSSERHTNRKTFLFRYIKYRHVSLKNNPVCMQ